MNSACLCVRCGTQDDLLSICESTACDFDRGFCRKIAQGDEQDSTTDDALLLEGCAHEAQATPFLVLVVLAVLAMVGRTTAHPLPPGDTLNSGDVAWMLTASALVLLMTPGLSFFYGGMVSFKNVVSTMLQSVIALGVISLAWVFVGFGLAFGHDVGGWGLVGNPLSYFMFDNVSDGTVTLGAGAEVVKLTVPLLVFSMFQLKFAIITPALITGSFAERVRFSAYLLFMVLFSLLIYCPLAHWTWHPQGIFFKWGVKDFAGGTVVHMSAGFAALAGALILGRRKSHMANEAHEAYNVPYVLLGTAMLWFGWFGFNAGSAGAANGNAALAFATTNTASACRDAGLDVLRLDARPEAFGDGRLHRSSRWAGRHHPRGRVRDGPRQRRHRSGRQRDLQSGRPLQEQVHT